MTATKHTPKPLKAHVKHIKPVKGDGPVTRLRKKRELNVIAELMWSKANAEAVKIQKCSR